MVLDIWRDVLVVRIRTGQLGDVGMFKGVIPGDLLASPGDFIAIISNSPDCKVDEFPNIQDHITFEKYLSLKFSQCRANGGQNQGRVLNASITLL